MRTRTTLVALGAAALTLVSPAAAQHDTLRQAVRKASETLGDLTKPITVNGEKLDPREVDRQMVYIVGQRQMQQKLIELIAEDQMAEQLRAGVKKATFDVARAEVDKSINDTIAEFRKKHPGKDFWKELAKTNTSKAEYLTMQRSTLLFDKVFFRGIPRDWPEITKEAIIASGGDQGKAFLEQIENSVKEGQQVPPMFLMFFRRWVIDKMLEWADVRYGSDGLDPAFCVAYNDRKWQTADAKAMLALRIKPEDRTRALVDIALQKALEQRLQKRGAWLSDKEFREEFAKFEEAYPPPFTAKVLALSFKGYPSYEIYKNRWRLERSFEQMIAKEIDEDSLGKHLEKAKAFLADGRLDVRVIRIPALDDATGTWKPHGFAEARGIADEVMRAIEGEDLTFDAAMGKHSKWPEHFTSQGQLLGKSLNELRSELRENEYTDFVNGFSVGDVLFYDVKPGVVAGPLKGQDGYYIAKVTSRTPAAGTMSLADKNQRDLVKQDYLARRFLAWANGVARATSVR